jgi:hypothetical protein
MLAIAFDHLQHFSLSKLAELAALNGVWPTQNADNGQNSGYFKAIRLVSRLSNRA